MRAIVVAAGSIGRKHLITLRKLRPDAELVVYRPYARGPRSGSVTGADKVIFQLVDALELGADIAVIASPATHHLDIALAFARRGIHLFVEKPLSASPGGIPELLKVCAHQDIRLMVGYVLRFHPALRALRDLLPTAGRTISVSASVGQHLAQWRPGRDPLTTVSARRDLGGGALLELSHEIDYVRWLAGPVTEVFADVDTLGELPLEVEDWATLVLRHSSGARSVIQLDMVQLVATRRCIVVGTAATLELDLVRGRLTRHAPEGEVVLVREPNGVASAYDAQFEHFLTCVEAGVEPDVSGSDGLAALDIVEGARLSAASGRVIALPLHNEPGR